MKKAVKFAALMGMSVVLSFTSIAGVCISSQASDYSTEYVNDELSEYLATGENVVDDDENDASTNESSHEVDASVDASSQADNVDNNEIVTEEDEIILEEEPSEDASSASASDDAIEIIDEASAEASTDSSTTDAAFDASSNQCGESATWSFNSSTGALTISGKGAIYDYTEENPAPWFQYNADIMSITIAEGITRIGNYAFFRAGNASETFTKGLHSVSFSKTVTEIGDYAFKYVHLNNNYRQFIIPDTVTKLGKGSFTYFCGFNSATGLGDEQVGMIFTIGNGIKVIPEDCFNGMIGVGLVLPDKLEKVEKNGLRFLQGVRNLEFPASLKEIGENGCCYYETYAKNASLRTITFKGNMPKLGEGAFAGRICYVYYPSGNSTYSTSAITKAKASFAASTWRPSDYKFTYKAGKDITWSISTVREGSYDITTLSFSGTGPMYDYSLDDLPDWYPEGKKINRISFASGITSIGNYAFYCLGNVNNSDYKKKYLVLPSKLSKIGDFAFSGCFIPLVKLPDSVEYIGASSCYGFKAATSTAFPKNVKYIGDSAFGGSEMTLNVSWDGIEHIGDKAFNSTKNISIPATFPDTLKYIGKEAFRDSKNISGKLVIPSSVEYIGNYAFIIARK